jgi:hypothetical protein
LIRDVNIHIDFIERCLSEVDCMLLGQLSSRDFGDREGERGVQSDGARGAHDERPDVLGGRRGPGGEQRAVVGRGVQRRGQVR